MSKYKFIPLRYIKDPSSIKELEKQIEYIENYLAGLKEGLKIIKENKEQE